MILLSNILSAVTQRKKIQYIYSDNKPRQTDRRTDGQTDRRTDRQTDRQTDRDGLQ